MSYKNFLKPLTAEFPEYLKFAGKVEAFSSHDHTPLEIEIFTRKVRDHYRSTLAKRFKAEKAVLSLWRPYVGGDDPGIQALSENHSTLKKLAAARDMDGLYHFGHKLKAYVRFESDVLFPRIEKCLGEREKAKLAVELAGFGACRKDAA